MSYYILTPTSNLGNILSSESISPAALYEKRSYGFKYFDLYSEHVTRDFIRIFVDLPDLTKYGDSDVVVPEQGNAGSCLEGEKEGDGDAPCFAQDENNLLREPEKKAEDDGAVITLMALELDESLVRFAPPPPVNGGFWTTETIRISPAKCTFIFRTEEDLNTSFNLVQRSIEVKFAQKYRDKAKVAEEKRLESEALVSHEVSGLMRPLHEDIGRYERIDRMKGAIFGYYLGFDYSLPKDPFYRDDAIDYLGTLHSMVNSVTSAKADEIDKKRRNLQRILFKFAIEKENSLSCQIQNMPPDERKSVGECFDLEEALSRLKKAAFVQQPGNMRNDSSGLEMYRTDLEERIHKAIYEHKDPFTDADKHKLGIKNEKGPWLQIHGEHGELASHILNDLIRGNTPENAKRSLGYDFALACGKSAKKHMGEHWEGSGERRYINGLSQHLNEMKDFDPNDRCGIVDDCSFETLKAIALLSGKKSNEELDGFYRYMLIQCKVADFCIPFAFWGATFGFSAMPKTLCDSMSENTENAARDLFDSVLDCMGERDTSEELAQQQT